MFVKGGKLSNHWRPDGQKPSGISTDPQVTPAEFNSNIFKLTAHFWIRHTLPAKHISSVAKSTPTSHGELVTIFGTLPQAVAACPGHCQFPL